VTARASLRHALLTAASVAFLIVLLAPPGSAGAAGETYTVVECDHANRGNQDAVLSDARSYFTHDACGEAGVSAVKIDDRGRAPRGAWAKARWSTHTSSLGIVAVRVSAKLRRHHGHASRLWIADGDQRQSGRVGSGGTGPTGYQRYRWSTHGPGQRQFVASLSCDRGGGCPASDRAKTWLRNVHLTVADYSDPVLNASGGLLAGGWRRGAQSLGTSADDVGSGVRQIAATVDRAGILTRRPGCAGDISGSPLVKTFKPCAGQVSFSAGSVNTAEPPFHDGQDAVSVCAVDFAGNRTCESRSVRIDNTPPRVAFASSQHPNDPELVKAPVSDPTSGVAGGRIYYRAVGASTWQPLATKVRGEALEARVDSTSVPPGQYEFLAQATDAAANFAETTKRQDGQPMVLSVPLKAGVRLTSHLAAGGHHHETIPYGQRSKVAGRLTDRAGHPLAHEQITVVEHFRAGALIDSRIRTVETDSDGLWTEKIPAGPSRRITARYDGSPRYLTDADRAGALKVKTGVTLRLSHGRVREGKRVVFRGRVMHYGARIPAAGKLVELQVKAGHDWDTVRHSFATNSAGKYRLRYRFGRFYTSNVRYRFRLKVLHEQGWAYKAPAKSKSRRLVVEAR
jgi:hypothetical protein